MQPSRYVKRLRSHHEALAPLWALAAPGTDFAARLRTMPLDARPRTIYVHVPFCTHNCTFCNLNRCQSQPPADYADLIVREIETYAAYRYAREGRYGAVYFGGGTPTSLSPTALRKILEALRSRLNVIPDAEVTIETTVSDLTEDEIAVFQATGVNRFSLGVQTFSSRGRRLLGRWGDGVNATDKIETLLAAGFRNVGIDLIYNWPGQTEEELLEDLATIESLDLAGLSFYALILREGTALHRMIAAGHSPPMGALEQEWRFFDVILGRLLDRGFTLLELTKLVRPTRDTYDYVRIRYENGDTLALGAGGGGRLGNLFYRNPADVADYRRQVEAPTGLPAEGFTVDSRYDFAHRLIGRLQFGRLDWSDVDSLPAAKGTLRAWVDALAADDLVKSDSQGLFLTNEGIFWGNNIGQEVATLLAKLFAGGDGIGDLMGARKHARSGRHPTTG